MKKYFRPIILCLALVAAIMPNSCKESPRSLPTEIYIASTSNPPGYYYPAVESFLPSVNPAPVNTQAFIIFNIPIDPTTISGNITVSSNLNGSLIEGSANDFELSLDNNVVRIIFHYGGSNPLLPGDTITVTTGTGVRDLDRGLALTAADVQTFTTDTAPDVTSPAISGAAGSTGPSGTGIELTDAGRIAASHDIHAVFTEEIDPSSINGSTFYLEDNLSTVVPARLAYAGGTYRATLTPLEDLLPGVTYTVFVTTGVRDLSQNTLAAPASWTFTTTSVPLDPTPGVDPTLSNLYVDSVSNVGASITWNTNEPANYMLNYGRGSGVSSSIDGSASYSSSFDVDLSFLDTNARHFFSIDYTDLEDYLLTGWLSTATYQFNTESVENPLDVIDSGASEQHNPKAIPYNPIDGSATGFFLFWNWEDTANRYIYGQLYDNSFSGQWNGGTRQPLYTAAGTWTYESASGDEAGGAIIIARTTANIAYAKRKIAAGAALEWGASGAANQTGIQVRNVAITNVSAVPVYAGMVQRIAPAAGTATAEMSSWFSLNNPFFDDDGTLGGLTDGDTIMDPVNHDGTTIDINSGTGQDFTYMVGQDAPIIASGDEYRIGSKNNSMTETAQDHEIYMNHSAADFFDYQSGSTPSMMDFYTRHGYPLPGGWTLNAGDIVWNGTSYGRLTAVAQLTPIAAPFDSGLADSGGGGDDHLYDSTKTWTSSPLVYVNDRVVNVDKNLVTYATAIADYDLTLNIPPLMNFQNNDSYDIYDYYCMDHPGDLNQFDPFYQFTSNWAMGITALTSFSIYDDIGISGFAEGIPAFPLCDNEANFSAGGVAAGDIVVNFTQHKAERVSAAATFVHMLSMDSQIIADGDDYGILRFRYGNTTKDDILCAGIATSGTATTLGDTGVNFTTLPTPVQPGDIAYNFTDGTQIAMVTAVTANTLTLSRNAGFAALSRYVIIRRRGVMFVFLNSGNIRGRVLSMEDYPAPGNAPVQVYPLAGTEFAIATGSAPRALSDGNGNAIVVYVNTNKVRATKINCIGTVVWGPVAIDTQAVATESILDVQPDTAGGVVVLYKYDGDIHAQHINSAGTIQWGNNGLGFDADGIAPAMVTTGEVMHYIYPDDIVVAANVNRTSLPAIVDDVYVWRRNSTGAGNWTTAMTGLGTVQSSPQLYVNGDTSVVLWDDNRFFNQSYIDTGYGLFGQNFHYSDGSRQWDADADAGTDLNGVSIVLNHFNEYAGVPLVAPYSNGTKAVLIWEDYRAGLGGDLLFRNLDGFTPP